MPVLMLSDITFAICLAGGAGARTLPLRWPFVSAMEDGESDVARQLLFSQIDRKAALALWSFVEDHVALYRS